MVPIQVRAADHEVDRTAHARRDQFVRSGGFAGHGSSFSGRGLGLSAGYPMVRIRHEKNAQFPTLRRRA